mmetsp:Transcript_4668/g.6519  ORF Transcript_4668/g.6519 Transcript_4668/m.6519 type:complete len:93 (+) Transcript_4668:2121-2399(+)
MHRESMKMHEKAMRRLSRNVDGLNLENPPIRCECKLADESVPDPFLSHLSSTVASASNIEGLHGLENDNDVVRKEGGGTRFLDLAACSLISC